MRAMEEMDIDEIVDVPDTPDRSVARRAIGRESMGRDSDLISGSFRGRDTLSESHVNGLRSKDKSVNQNGNFRRPPIIRPPKSFSNPRTTGFISPNVLSSSENSFASENPRLFRKVSVDESSSHRGKHTSGVRNMDKGKSVRTDKSCNYQEGSNFCDLTSPNGRTGSPKTDCPSGVANDKKKGKMASSGSSSGSRIQESWDMFKKSFMGNGQIDEDTPKDSELATVHGVVVKLSPDSQHKTGERSSLAVTSPRVAAKKCLVRNGCISPQNIAKAELLKSSSRNIEQSHTSNGVSDFTHPPRDLISDLIAQENEENYRGRMKGKSILTISDTSKEQDENLLSGTSSSIATDSREANGTTSARRDAFDSQGLGGWRRTHNHSGKPDIIIRDAAERLSRRVGGSRSFSQQQHESRVYRRESGRNHEIECDHAEGETAVRATSVSETGQSSGRPHSEKIVTKRLKKQGPTSMTRECSTSTFEDPDFLILGSSRDPMNSRSFRAQHSQSRDRFCPIIEVDEFSSPARRSTPQSLDSTNDDDSDARARQVEADEILARELQEQLYHEMPIVGGGEIDERLVWAMQQEDHGSNTYSESQNAPRHTIIADVRRHSRLQPIQSRPIGSDGIDEQLAWALLQDDDVSDSYGASQNASYARGPVIPNLPRQARSRPSQSRSSRTQSQPNRRGTLARVTSSNRMAQLRGRTNRQRRAVSHSARNLQFPVDMDLDMRLDILETLEATFENFRDVDIDNPIYQFQRDFNENDYELLLALDEHNHHHAGASSNQINSLPQSVVQTDNQEACAICLENPTIGETVRHLPCLHKFHKDCIDPWLSRKTSCPVCKCSIT